MLLWRLVCEIIYIVLRFFRTNTKDVPDEDLKTEEESASDVMVEIEKEMNVAADWRTDRAEDRNEAEVPRNE